MAQINNIQNANTAPGTNNVNTLTPAQQQILDKSGLTKGTPEYQALETKMKMGNLDSAVSLAKELADLIKKMRDTVTQGLAR